MTSAGTTQHIPTSSAEKFRLTPRLERGPSEPVDTSPLWPLVLLLAEIAARVELEQAAASAGTGELLEDEARPNGHGGTGAADNRSVPLSF